MKKTKRLLALLLAVMVIVGLLAVPAAAATGAPSHISCPVCGTSAYMESHNPYELVRQYATSCTRYSGTHTHGVYSYTAKYVCNFNSQHTAVVTGTFDRCYATE